MEVHLGRMVLSHRLLLRLLLSHQTGRSLPRDAKGRGLSSLHRTSLAPTLHPRSLCPNSEARTLTFRVTAGASEGFNWSDNFRTRAQRTTSITGQGNDLMPQVSANNHTRAKSVAIMEPPVREMPREPQRPDHFQERILKGDFYMD